MIVLLWRAGLGISEALALAETDLNRTTDGMVVRRGKGDKRREVAWTVGVGSRSTPGSTAESLCPSVACCASST
ncbi:MAG: hypothetical protein M3N47_08950, partial [Chloroflexota bacterium]|nr:hypothetical protein [Chloroflexota bacterium]